MGEDLSLTELRVHFSLPEDDLAVLRKIEMELRRDLDPRAEVVQFRLQESSVGVGASGPAFELIAEVARVAFDDVERLVVLGGWLLWIKERVAQRRRRMTVISDGPSLGAVAAAAIAPSLDLAGYRLVGCQPLTGWPQYPHETDERFVWVAAFQHDERHEVLAVFMSPAGLVLGQAVVPLHGVMEDRGFRLREVSEIRRLFRERNTPSPEA